MPFSSEHVHPGRMNSLWLCCSTPMPTMVPTGTQSVGAPPISWLLDGRPDATPETMAGNQLLLNFLRKSLNRDAGLERKLIALREATAKALLKPSPPPRINDLAAAIAEQAWLNEYIWPDDPIVPNGPAGAMYRPQSSLLYPGALHIFDAAFRVYLDQEGHMQGAHPEARADSYVVTKDFFDARLKSK